MNLLKKIYPLLFFLFLGHTLSAQNYAVSDIPESLLKDANAVVRVDERIFTVQTLKQAFFRRKLATTILNKKGEYQAVRPVFYDDFTKINFLEARLYDKNGKLIKKLKKSDIRDRSAISGGTLYGDNRVKVAEMRHYAFPYTVEFEYETIENNLFFYPAWYPQRYSKTSIQSARMEVIMPSKLPLRFKEFNLDKRVQISEEGKTNKYIWEVNNLKVYKSEKYSEGKLVPFVWLAPSKFELDGYTGDLTTWKSFGDFQNKLNEGRGELPEATKRKIRSLTSGISEPRERVKKVYEYLQENTRYVSVQLGIGGWQPFDAKFVDEKGYGDCKALSNYTKSLLKEIGIESYYTLVDSGDDNSKMYPDFAVSQFNHVILAVPLPQDTIWLECTSQNQAFDYMSDFTGNREALLITPEGGKVVKTPQYHENENLLTRNLKIKLDEEGNATFDAETCYQALEEGARHFVVELAQEDQKKWLYDQIELPSFEIDEFSLKRDKDILPKTWENLKLSVRKYASKSGKRIFLPINPLNVQSLLRPSDEERKSEVFIENGFTHRDTIDYEFPQDFRVEYHPKNIVIDSEFGSYKVTFIEEEGRMKYCRYLQLKHGTYPKGKYEALVKFFKDINKADKTKVVLVNKS